MVSLEGESGAVGGSSHFAALANFVLVSAQVHNLGNSGERVVKLKGSGLLNVPDLTCDDDCAVYCSFQNQTSNTFGEGTYSII